MLPFKTTWSAIMSLKTFGLYPEPDEKNGITSYGFVENDSDLVHGPQYEFTS
jgi:hypothetical protein